MNTRTRTKRLLSILTALCMMLSIACALWTESYAAPSLPAVNTETRHAATCTALSADAQAYYTGQYTYANLSALSGASNVSTSARAMQNNNLYDALQELMESTHTYQTSYSGTGAGSLAYYWQRTDANAGNAGSFVLFYSDDIVSMNASSSFNREHVWPKSNASFNQSGGGSDLHHLRPADPTVNSTRSNLPFGDVRAKGGNYTTGSCFWKTSSLFEPKDDVKGDVARVLLYVYVRWGENNLYTDTSNGGKIIESLDTLLEWIAIDPVDTWEMKRNDLTEDVQGNRNVFIDYPELAYLMFGREVPDDLITPSKTCSHTWTQVSSVAATCTASGTITYRCNKCGTTKTETVDPLGHNYDAGTVTLEPTYTSTGTRLYTCSRCGDTYTEQIPMLTQPVADRYDLDGSGETDVSDVTALLNALAGKGSIDEEKADLDGSGDLSVNDVTALLNHIANPVETQTDIVFAAYSLSQGSSLEGEKTLTGKVVSIGEKYSEAYGNVTLTIVVGTLTNKPIDCFRMKGAEAAEGQDAVDISALAPGDTITVKGTLTNYHGKIEFTSGCRCTAILGESDVGHALAHVTFAERYNSGDKTDAPSEDDEYTSVTFSYAFSVENGEAPVTVRSDILTFGEVNVVTPVTITVTATDGTETYSEQYTVNVYPAGYVESMEEIVNAAYELASGESLDGEKTLTGVVTAVVEAWNGEYISVRIVVGELTDKPILCYHVTGEDGVDPSTIFENDTITVTGTITSYYGTKEFTNTSKITNIVKYQYTDAEKVEFEKEQLSVTPVDGTSLPLDGTVFKDVMIVWSLPAGETNVRIVRGVLTIDNTGLTQSKDVTLTAILSLGAVSVNKTFTVAVSAPSSGQTEAKTWTLTFPDGNDSFVNNYTSDWTAAMSGLTWSFAHFNNGQQANGWTSIRAGHKTIADAQNAKITFAVGGTVETVKLNIEQIDATLTDGIVLNVKDNSGAILASVAIDSLTAGEHTFVVPAGVRASGLTYEIVVSTKLSGSSGSNGFDRISGVTVEGFVSTSGDDPQPCTHIWSSPVYTWAVDYSTCSATATCTVCGEQVSQTVNVSAQSSGNLTTYTAAFTKTPFTTQTKTVAAQSGTTGTATVNFSQQGYTNSQEITTVTFDDVTAVFDKGTNNNTPKYFDSGASVRLYGGGTLTLTAPSGKLIKSIKITFGSGDGSNSITVNVGNFDGSIWTGSSNTVAFTVGGSSGNRRFASITVTYEG